MIIRSEIIDAALHTALYPLCIEQGATQSEDVLGNHYAWYRLATTQSLIDAAAALAHANARLLTITAYEPGRRTALLKEESTTPPLEIAYHFDVNAVALTVTVKLDPKARTVPSITPHFRNADWNEREFMELYDITVTDHPNPRRLFLDESLEAGVLSRLIPLSTLTNGASTTDLWERILASRAGE